MMTPCCQPRLLSFAQRLRRAAPADRPDLIAQEAIETGDTYLPRSSRNDAAMNEIDLHGIYAMHPDTDCAIDEWLSAAIRRIRETDNRLSTRHGTDPDLTLREIEHARTPK